MAQTYSNTMPEFNYWTVPFLLASHASSTALYARFESPDLTIPYYATCGRTGKVGSYYKR